LWDIRVDGLDLRLLVGVFLIMTILSENSIKIVKENLKILLFMFGILCFIFVHLIFNNIIYDCKILSCHDLNLSLLTLKLKEVISIIGLIVVIGCFIVYKTFYKLDFKRYINVFILLNCTFQYLQVLKFYKFGISAALFNHWPYYRYSGLFAEPSHLALAYGPIFYIFLLNFINKKNNKKELFFFTLLLISSFFSISATLLISFTFASFLAFFQMSKKVDLKKIYLLIFICTLLLGTILFSKPIMNRIFDSQNLSSYVFLTHSKSSLVSLKQNYSIGYGLNNYERSFYESIEKKLIKKHPAHNDYILLNYNDGSNNFNKLLGEFGIGGVFLIFFLLIKIFRGRKNTDYLFLFCSFSFFVMTFIRAAGYFNAGYLLAILILVFQYKKNSFFKAY
jgi:hypothetical protein